MRLWIAIAIVEVGFAMAAMVGCAAKRPANYRFTGCRVTQVWVDQNGNQRRDCDCKNGRQVGWDAKTRAAIIRCE